MFDTAVFREVCLLEYGREFVRRYKSKDVDKTAIPMFSSSCPGTLLTLHPFDNKVHESLAEIRRAHPQNEPCAKTKKIRFSLLLAGYVLLVLCCVKIFFRKPSYKALYGRIVISVSLQN